MRNLLTSLIETHDNPQRPLPGIMTDYCPTYPKLRPALIKEKLEEAEWNLPLKSEAVKQRAAPILRQISQKLEADEAALNTLLNTIKSKIDGYQWKPLSEFKLAKEPFFFNIQKSTKFEHTLLACNKGRVTELIDPNVNFGYAEIV